MAVLLWIILVLFCSSAVADEKQTPYVATDLKATFAVLDKQIREENQYLSKMITACEKMKTQHDVDGWIKKTMGMKLPEPKIMRQVLLEEKNGIASLEDFRYKLEQLLSRTRSMASQECQAASQATQPSEIQKTISSELQHRVVQAERLYKKADDQGTNVISLLSDHSRIPSPKSYHDELNAGSTRLATECEESADVYRRFLRSSLFGNVYRKDNQTFLQIESRLKRAKELLKEAKEAGYEHADIYQYRLEEFTKTVKKITMQHDKHEHCSKRYDHILNACYKFVSDHRYKNLEKIKYEYNKLRDGILQLRKEKLAKVKSGMQNITQNKELVIKAVAGAKNCLKAAQAKFPEGPSPEALKEATAIKASCERGANSTGIAKLSMPRYAKVPGVGKNISDLRKVNSALAKEASSSADGVQAYRKGKADDAIAALNKAQRDLDSVSSVIQCTARENKIKIRIAKAIRFKKALSEVESAISGCERRALKKVQQLYGKDTHPVLKRKISHVRKQLKLLQKFQDAGNAYRNNELDTFVHIMQQVNGKGAAIACGRLDKKAQKQIEMIEQAKKDQARVTRLAVACRLSALRELESRYRRESDTITLAKEIYVAAVDAINDCKRKESERRAEEEKKKAKKEAEAKRKAEAEERTKRAQEEAEKENAQKQPSANSSDIYNEALKLRPTCNPIADGLILMYLKDPSFFDDPRIAKGMIEISKKLKHPSFSDDANLTKRIHEFEQATLVYKSLKAQHLYKKGLVGLDGKQDAVTPAIKKDIKSLEVFASKYKLNCDETIGKFSKAIDKVQKLRDTVNELKGITTRCDKEELKQTEKIYTDIYNNSKHEKYVSEDLYGLQMFGGKLHELIREELDPINNQLFMWGFMDNAEVYLEKGDFAFVNLETKQVINNGKKHGCPNLVKRAKEMRQKIPKGWRR